MALKRDVKFRDQVLEEARAQRAPYLERLILAYPDQSIGANARFFAAYIALGDPVARVREVLVK